MDKRAKLEKKNQKSKYKNVGVENIEDKMKKISFVCLVVYDKRWKLVTKVESWTTRDLKREQQRLKMIE